jgi:hypothetical protein
MTDAPENIDISQAIILYLGRYPMKNDEAFTSFYGPALAPAARAKVRSILDEAIKVDVDWTDRSLLEGSIFVRSVVAHRHPELSEQALKSIGNYYSYLMR